MDSYLHERPVPFLAWLRQLAALSIRDTHRLHIGAQRRSVERERQFGDLSDDSAVGLGERLLAADTSPSNRLLRAERRDQVKAALLDLPDRDREVLVMRYLEHADAAEIAEALGLSVGAVKVRLLRAINRMRARLEACP